MTKDRKPKFFYGYVIVVAAFAVMLIGMGGINSFGVFLEPVLLEFGWTRAVTSGAFSLCFILYAFLTIGAGRLNDRFGPRLLLTGSGLLLGLGYLLMSQISAIWHLYLYYGVIIGIGFAGYFIPTLSTVARWFVKRRGMMTGIALSGVGVGTMIMPMLARWLISSYGWRVSFTAIGIISFVLIVSVAQFLKRDPQIKGQLPDGETELKHENSNLAATGFSFREAIRTRQLWMLGLALFCFGFSVYAILVHIVIHATGLGLPVTGAVNTLSIIGGLSIASRILVGNAGDRIGNQPALLVCLILLSVALFWLLLAKELWMFYLFGAIFGFAYGGAYALLSPLAAESFGLRSHGALLGVIDAATTVGATIGPVALGYIFDKTGSYQLGFLILGGMSIIGLILALLLKPISSEGWRNN